MVDKSKFADEGYRVEITGRHVEVTEAMKQHAVDKLAKLERIHDHIMDVHVWLDIVKLEHTCTIVMNFSHFKIKVSATSSDMYASIDKAVQRLQTKMRRWKTRLQDHHNKPLKVVDLEVNVLQAPFDEVEEFNEEIEEQNAQEVDAAFQPHKIIGTDTRSLKTLTVEEAMMKMDLSDDVFLIFKDESDKAQALKVIYRREDGNYGLIKTQ